MKNIENTLFYGTKEEKEEVINDVLYFYMKTDNDITLAKLKEIYRELKKHNKIEYNGERFVLVRLV